MKIKSILPQKQMIGSCSIVVRVLCLSVSVSVSVSVSFSVPVADQTV